MKDNVLKSELVNIKGKKIVFLRHGLLWVGSLVKKTFCGYIINVKGLFYGEVRVAINPKKWWYFVASNARHNRKEGVPQASRRTKPRQTVEIPIKAKKRSQRKPAP